MSVSKINKIHLTVLKKDYDSVIDLLHKKSFVEIEPWNEMPEGQTYSSGSKADYWFTGVKFAIELLTPYYVPEKKKFSERLGPATQEIDKHELENIVRNFDYKKLIVELEDLDKENNTIKNSISQLKRDMHAEEGWKGLPLIARSESDFVRFSVGTVAITRYEDLTLHALKLSQVELLKISEGDKEVRLVVAYTRDIQEDVLKMFEIADFKIADIELTSGKSVDERLHEYGKQIEKLERQGEQVEQRIMEYTTYLPKFKMLYDHLSWKAEQDEASENALATQETVNVIGWIESHRRDELEKDISVITPDYAIEELQIGEDENRPVVLRNGNMVTPFESVTEIYGAPQYSEPDPTVYLAPFFLLYFALCLTDAGYGLLLAILAFVAIQVMKPKGGSMKIMKLMVFGGILTFIIGALFGGWFGIVLDELPAGGIKDFFTAIRLIDPVASPMTVLLLSFILGYFQMIVGNVIDMIWKIKHDQAKDGLMGSGMWALFLLIVGFWIAVKAGAVPESFSTIAHYALYAGVAGMVLTQGREGKNVFIKFGKGLASLYGLVGYLSDILSYSRLLALGLSTGIIAMVVNLVAGLFANMVPAYLGWLVWIVIIVGGHIFNLAINVLGAFIHSSRLQFVEYFPKFIVGGGRKFKPLTRTSKFISVKN